MSIIERIEQALENTVTLDEKVELINRMRETIHNLSPFKENPVDLVLWVKNDKVTSNDYNPNKVAPPEMKLLETSIVNDGYTQPIVTWINADKKKVEVIDGFHRNRVGKESSIVRDRVHSYLPIVVIRKEQEGKNDRIASTIRHNRARGKHQVDAMSEIVLELKNRNWKNDRIARELGMDEEEILRLCQISGLQDIFKDDDFSKSWESSDAIPDAYTPISDEFDEDGLPYRTINTDDPNRIFHTFDKWECHKAGFYKGAKECMTASQCEFAYAEFLSDTETFSKALQGVIDNWKHSCEHYLTNRAMNRIAWLGQASVCYATGIPSKYCGGWNLMSTEQQDIANSTALYYLNKWLVANDRPEVTMEEALSQGRQVNIY